MRFHIFLEDSSERETSLRDRLWMVLSNQREILQTPTEYHLPHLLQESYRQSAEIYLRIKKRNRQKYNFCVFIFFIFLFFF